MRNRIKEMFNFAEREKKKRTLKRLRGGDAEPIDKDAEVHLFCPKHGLQRIEHCRFERITKGKNNSGDQVIFGRSKDHKNPIRFSFLTNNEGSIESDMYETEYTKSTEGSKRLALIIAMFGVVIIAFQQIWLVAGWELGRALGESLWFNRMFSIIIGGICFGGPITWWFSGRTNYHYLPLVCTGEHEGNIHQVAVPGRESFMEAMGLFFNSDKNTEAIEVFNNMRKNFDEKLGELNDEIDEQRILREEAQEKNLMRQGIETARALREDLADDYMTGKDVALFSIVASVATAIIVYILMTVG